MSPGVVRTLASDLPPWLRTMFCLACEDSLETDSIQEARAQKLATRIELKKRRKDNKAKKRSKKKGHLSGDDDSETLRKSHEQTYDFEREDNKVSEERQNQTEVDYYPVHQTDPVLKQLKKEKHERLVEERREARRVATSEGSELPSPGPQALTFPKPDSSANLPSTPTDPLQSTHRRDDSGVGFGNVLAKQGLSTPIQQQISRIGIGLPREEPNMTPRSDVTYFGAGPALLPTSVLEKAAQALVNFNETGLGIAEHSHRSALATDIVEQTKADLKTYLDVPDGYEVLFMQAGGSGEFSATVTNFVGFWVEGRRQQILKDLSQEVPEADLAQKLLKAVDEELKLDYLVTGSWSLKASQEAARLLGPEKVNIVTDARGSNDGKFGKIPHESTWKLSKKPAMIYYCDNETVDGVEFPGFPKCLEPGQEEPIVVADMSSNILSRRIPIKNFSVIFFGAQKNLGSTGITVVIIKKILLPPVLATSSPSLMRKLGLPIGPIVLDYATIAKNSSLYNTLPIFDVYVAGEVLKTLLAKYPNKVDGQELISNEKAKLIYAALDAHPESYRVVPDKSARSRMNICFRVTHGGNIDEAEKAFLKAAGAIGLQGLKGHRSVGGIRASNYNSIDLEGAQKLEKFIEDFAESPIA